MNLKTLWDALLHHGENGAEEFTIKVTSKNPGSNFEVDLYGAGPRAKAPTKLSVTAAGDVHVISAPAASSLEQELATAQEGASPAVANDSNATSAGGTDTIETAPADAAEPDDAAGRQAHAEQAPPPAGSGDPVQADVGGPGEGDAADPELNETIEDASAK